MRFGCFTGGLLTLLLALALVATSADSGMSLAQEVPSEPPQTLTAAAVEIGATQTLDEEYARLLMEDTLRAPAATALAHGHFNAYVLDVPDGIGAKLTVLEESLSSRYGWVIHDIAPENLRQIDPQDAQMDGQVLVIPGGSAPLSDNALKAIQDYVAQGGDLLIMAGTNLNEDKISLATDSVLNDWLYQTFGMKFDNDVVIDKAQYYQSPLVPVADNLNHDSFITTNGILKDQSAIIFEAPNSITIADAPPADVTVTALASSTGHAYAKSNLQDVLDNKINFADGDTVGPLVLAASAENTQSGAHVVLLGSTSLGDDQYASFPGIVNLSVTFNSLIWAASYQDYFGQLNTRIAQTVEPKMTQLLQQTVDARNPQATLNPLGAQQTAVGQSFLTALAVSRATATPTSP